MKACVVTCRDPFRPANHRHVDIVRRRRSLRNLAPKTRSPVVCQVNGEWISRKAWARRVQDGDSVVFVVLPQGGGGKSNPLAMILMIAIMIFAPYAAAAIGNIGGVALTTAAGGLTLAGSMVAGAIGMIGSALVNALVPAPKASQSTTTATLAAASPTYSLGAQGNSARIGQPIPVIYGRHQVFPDFAAMPYVEYAGNEQYLYQLFCVGQGEYSIEQIRVEDTPISSFQEITYQIVPPGSKVTLFPSSVITSAEVSGQEMLTGTIVGPFVANASGTVTNALAFDVVFPRGLYFFNSRGGTEQVSISWRAEAQQINDVGAAIGPWVVLGSESYSAGTTTPQRRSYKYGVPDGRYQCRVIRTDTKQTGTNYAHEIDWSGLRAYLPGSEDYGNVTLVAMRMRATNNLSSQASRKINMIVTRKLQTWNPTTGWTTETVPTRSIAWALADICRADYGANLPDSRINLRQLYDLDQIWTERGDTCNGVFDTQSVIMEALSLVSRTGRAISFIQGGIVHTVRDQPASIPVAMFSQRNIVKNSLKIDYLMASEETADCVDITYFDEDIWAERTVRASLPGVSTDKPATVKLPFVTSRQQAWNEGMYIAACNRYRRRLPTFSTEMEGFIPTLGDLIAVQHDMPKWGQSGEIVAWNPATKTAIVNEPLDWSAGVPCVLAFRGRDGAPRGPFSAVAGTDAYHVVLTDWEPAGANWSDGLSDKNTPDTTGTRERSHFAFGPANQQYIQCRLVSMRPRSSETVELLAVVESDYVHLADTGVAPGVNAWQLPSKFTTPIVLGLTARSQPSDIDNMLLSWQPAPGAEYYIIEQSSGDDTWTRCGESSAANYSVRAIYGSETVVRVAAVGVSKGPWIQINYAGVADYMWVLGDDNEIMWLDGDDDALMW